MSAFDDMLPSEDDSRSLERLLGCSHNLVVLVVALISCCLLTTFSDRHQRAR